MRSCLQLGHKIISIHAPRVGSDVSPAVKRARITYFNPRSPCGERRPRGIVSPPHPPYFNPRSPCGERLFTPWTVASSTDFNPRSPCGERLSPVPGGTIRGFISIHAPRVGSDRGVPGVAGVGAGISIHAPRVGSDRVIPFTTIFISDFNPRSPCGERPGGVLTGIMVLFDFNPRSPCGERL